MADIELRREQTIQYAEHYKDYELSLSKHQYDHERTLLQDEYEVITLYIEYMNWIICLEV